MSYPEADHRALCLCGHDPDDHVSGTLTCHHFNIDQPNERLTACGCTRFVLAEPFHRCRCGQVEGACPECGTIYPLGVYDRCLQPACRQVNAPIDCLGCNRVVASSLDGVLTLEGNLVPWKRWADDRG